MAKRLLRLGRLIALAAAVTGLLTAVSLVNASAAVVQPNSCPTNKPLVVDSWFTTENSADYGVDGHVWALDAGTRWIQIWSLGGSAYCIKIRDAGSFTTFAGLSPEGTGSVPAGVTGSLDDTAYLNYYGTFAPTASTTGFLGNFDVQCQQDGTCAGTFPGITRLYFSIRRSLHSGAFTATYSGGACGTWTQTNSGDTGDIAC